MTAVNPDGSRQAVVEAALVLLEQIGRTPADLAAGVVRASARSFSSRSAWR